MKSNSILHGAKSLRSRLSRRGWLGLMALSLPLLLTACADNLSANEVASRYLEAVQGSNYTAAYDLLTSDSQLKFSRSQFVDRLTRARQEAGLTKTELVKIQNPNVAGKRASVAYQLEVTLQNGQKLNLFESMVLLQEESGWRVIWPPQ